MLDAQKWSELAQQVRSVLKKYPKLRLSQGRKVGHASVFFLFLVKLFTLICFSGGVCDLVLKVALRGRIRMRNVGCLTFNAISLIQVLEIRPTIKWDKGKAIEFLLESLGEF